MRIKYLAISIFIFFGCSNPDKIVEATDIDKELASLLEATSNGKGKSFYELPLSDIFFANPSGSAQSSYKRKSQTRSIFIP